MTTTNYAFSHSDWHRDTIAAFYRFDDVELLESYVRCLEIGQSLSEPSPSIAREIQYAKDAIIAL